jgi:hypothetical protein
MLDLYVSAGPATERFLLSHNSFLALVTKVGKKESLSDQNRSR